jgi:hypothetical protein
MTGPGPPLDVGLRDLAIRCEGGCGATVGQAYHPSFDTLEVTGTWWGIGPMPGMGNTYDIRLRDCQLNGTDACYYGHGQIVFIDNLKRADVGACLVRLDGCGGKMLNIIGGTNSPKTTVALVDIIGGIDYGASYEIDGIGSDEELGHFAPLVRCEKIPPGTTLDIRGVVMRGEDPKIPLIVLVDRTGNDRPGRLLIRSPMLMHIASPIVSTEGAWEGTIEGLDLDVRPKSEPIVSTDPTGRSRVISVHYGDGLPTAGTWLAGAHRIIRRNPGVGDWTEARCVRSGTYGTDHPPQWAVTGTLAPAP